MFHVIHHVHRIRTVLKYACLDCPGEEVGVYRCCVCRKTFHGTGGPFFSSVGQPENDHAYTVIAETHG